MEELLKVVSAKLGIPTDKVGELVKKLLGFIRAKVPAQMAGQFDSAVGATEPLPAADNLEDIAKETNSSPEQVQTALESIMTFLKGKLPADAFGSVQELLGSAAGKAGGIMGMLKGLFGGKS